MKVRYLFVILLFASLFLLSSCSTMKGLFGGDKESPTNINTNFNKGTQGLEIGFVENMPPSTMKVGDSFQVQIALKNNGASDITRGEWVFTNLEHSYMGVKSTRDFFDLSGRSLRNSEGGFELITLDGNNLGIPTNKKKESFIFDVQACYNYHTKASAQICLNSLTDKDAGKSACEIKDTKLDGGQGGPIALTKIEQRSTVVDSSSYQNHFLLYIKNVGEGKVSEPKDANFRCGIGFIRFNDIENIYVEVSLAGQNITSNCRKPQLDTKDPTLMTMFCYYETETNIPGYYTLLTVDMNYYYVSKEIQKIITVEESIGGGSSLCEAQRCQPDSGTRCDYFDGIDRTAQCLDPHQICCMNEKPDCERSLDDSTECKLSTDCATGDRAIGGCDEGKVCCKKGSTVEVCPEERCNPSSVCYNGLGGISSTNERCPSSGEVCCVYGDLAVNGISNCGRAGTGTEGGEYLCMNPENSDDCKQFLCPGGASNRCCRPTTTIVSTTTTTTTTTTTMP